MSVPNVVISGIDRTAGNNQEVRGQAALHRLIALPGVLTVILVVNVFAYFVGLTLWYGPVMSDPATPAWAWLFIPDCPLFGLLGALGLLMATAQRFWNEEAQARAQRVLLTAGVAALLLWPLLQAPMVRDAWSGYGSLFAVLGVSLLVCGALFRRAPVWFLCVLAAGQIKYGLWTITAWALFWRNTDALFGAPMLTPDSIVMTISHIGLTLQGLAILSYLRPTPVAGVATLAWFGVSDFVDYGLGWYPALPPIIPLPVMQWSTIAVTWTLGIGFLAFGLASAQRSPRRAPQPARL